MDDGKKQKLKDIFWEMNEITSRTESVSETIITETDDGNGNIVSVLDEDGHQTTAEYDLNNRPVSMCYSDGREAAFRYNSRGELVELTDWNGITTMEYGVTGKLAKVTDHNGLTTGYEYDAAGRYSICASL